MNSKETPNIQEISSPESINPKIERDENLPFTIDDICFLPEQESIKDVNKLAKLFFKNNKEIIEKDLGPMEYIHEFFHRIDYQYTIHSSEFNLFKLLPKEVQRYVASFNTIKNCDPYAILPFMPYAKFGYIILEDGITHDTIKTFGLERLKGIRQLGFMLNPIIHREQKFTSVEFDFKQTRGLHSLDVAAFLRLIVDNNPDNSIDKYLIYVAAISHDALTPAGSDTTKMINFELFDEDTHYGELFEKPDWKILKEKYNLDEEKLKDIIMNKGISGEFLDIADKIAYVARDVLNFLGLINGIGEKHKNKGLRELEKLLKTHPDFCDIWKDIKIHEGKMVIENGEKLGIFLKVRALMYAELYYNPDSRFLEYMLSKKVTKFLFESNQITRDELLEWTDYDLEKKIDGFLGSKYSHTDLKKSIYKKYENEEDRQKDINELKSNKSFIAIPDDFKCTTKTGVNKYSILKDGKVMIFKDAYPEIANEIEEIMKTSPGFGLYTISLEDLGVPVERYEYIKQTLENME